MGAWIRWWSPWPTVSAADHRLPLGGAERVRLVSVGLLWAATLTTSCPKKVVMKGTARWVHPQVGESIEAG